MAQRLYKASILKLQTTKTELAHLKNLNETKIATLIKEKEAVIENLQKEINQYESIHSGRNLVEINKQLMDTFVYKKLAYIECHPQEKITDETWDNLEETLEGMIPSLANIKLKLSKKGISYLPADKTALLPLCHQLLHAMQLARHFHVA